MTRHETSPRIALKAAPLRPPRSSAVARGEQVDTAGERAAAERRVVKALVGELGATFGAQWGTAAVWTCLQQAISDLRGSVSLDALPEMAARLAHHRLSCASRPEWRDRADQAAAGPTGQAPSAIGRQSGRRP